MSEMQAGFEFSHWLQYTADVSLSLKHHARSKEYRDIQLDLEEGKTILLSCELAGSSERLHIVVEDFVTFNWVMDKLEDPLDPLTSVTIQTASFTMSKAP